MKVKYNINIKSSRGSKKSSNKYESVNINKRSAFKRSQTKISKPEVKNSIASRRSSDKTKNSARNVADFENALSLTGINKDKKYVEPGIFLDIRERSGGTVSKFPNFMQNASFSKFGFEEESLIKFISPSRESCSNLLSWAKQIHNSMERKGSRMDKFLRSKPIRKLIVRGNNQIIKKQMLMMKRQ